jgi:hypothetical protein
MIARATTAGQAGTPAQSHKLREPGSSPGPAIRVLSYGAGRAPAATLHPDACSLAPAGASIPAVSP